MFGGLESIDDPRPDSAAKNEAGIKDGLRYNVQGSYGILKWKWGELTLDTSAGYFKGDVGDLEVSAEFTGSPTLPGVDPPHIQCGDTSKYHVFYVPVGKMTQIPVQFGGTVRFRPRASGGPFRGMSPYIGGGIGYIFAKIDASEEFLAFSNNVRHSTGYALRPTGNGSRVAAEPEHRLQAAKAEAPDSFEYHARAGIEVPVRKGLFVVLDTSWIWAREAIRITTDGKEEFGTKTPNGRTDIAYPVDGLPVVIVNGGLIDYASGPPEQDQNDMCKFHRSPKDGIADPGNYYVQGGKIKYSGFTVGLGVRYQF
jgi:opacity protein-like surface antigen